MNGNQDVFDPMGTGKYRGESVSNVAPVDVQPIVVPETPQENVTESPKQTPLTFSVLERYGEDLTAKQYITNPAIAREEEIKRMIIILLTPEKSALLVGKPGIGKTAIVEGLAYLIERDQVPDALKGYRIIKLNSTSLVGKILINGKEELIMNILVDELKHATKTIVFIDEIHTLIGGQTESMDLANMLKA